jgi:uncharacterized protein (DUF1810 family)
VADDDPFDLQRFVDAQAPLIERVRDEMRAGEKRSHWMWFVFPQLRGLGQSPTAIRYGIASQAEAQAYLADPILGPRLRECTQLAIDAPATSLEAIFGGIDALKFRSCMTLFDVADGSAAGIFARALARWCDGIPDGKTLALLKGAP